MSTTRREPAASDAKHGRGADPSPLAVGHVGITVPDVDRATAWYSTVLGLEVLVAPTTIVAGDTHGGRCAAEVFGDRFASMRQSQLLAANGVGIELFQFLEPATPQTPAEFDYWRPGPFHICVLDDDIKALVRRIVDAGGRQRTAIHDSFPGRPYRWCYCEDPFGVIIEVYTHTHNQVYGPQPPVEDQAPG